jgi:hypothetical protein
MDFSSYEVSFKEARKALHESIVKGASFGGDDQRHRLLAYAFIRRRPYSALERITQAQHYCEVGKDTYYSFLASNVAIYVREAFKIDKTNGKGIYDEIFAWMKEHFAAEEKEAAE